MCTQNRSASLKEPDQLIICQMADTPLHPYQVILEFWFRSEICPLLESHGVNMMDALDLLGFKSSGELGNRLNDINLCGQTTQ